MWGHTFHCQFHCYYHLFVHFVAVKRSLKKSLCYRSWKMMSSDILGMIVWVGCPLHLDYPMVYSMIYLLYPGSWCSLCQFRLELGLDNVSELLEYTDSSRPRLLHSSLILWDSFNESLGVGVSDQCLSEVVTSCEWVFTLFIISGFILRLIVSFDLSCQGLGMVTILDHAGPLLPWVMSNCCVEVTLIALFVLVRLELRVISTFTVTSWNVIFDDEFFVMACKTAWLSWILVPILEPL